MTRLHLQDIPQTAQDMLGGLHGDAALRERILSAAASGAKPRVRPFRPALAMACAFALVAVGLLAARLILPRTPGNETVTVGIHAAGDTPAPEGVLIAHGDPGTGMNLQITGANAPAYESLFVDGTNGNYPLIGTNGRVYRLLAAPAAVDSGLLGTSLGSIALHIEEPALADPNAWYGALSNAVDAGAEFYSVAGLSDAVAIIAPVGGQLRLFQRASFAGYGAGGGSLADVLNVNGQAIALTLSDVGTIDDPAAANELVALLQRTAAFRSDDPIRAKQSLNIHLANGLTLQLLVSGNSFSACGTWSCPEFQGAFEAAMAQ